MHFLQRVARDMPEVELHSVFLRGGTFIGRRIGLPEEINPVDFRVGSVTEALPNRGVSLWTDWRSGDRVMAYLREHNIGMVILNGYRSTTLLRAIRWCRRAGVPVLMRGDSNIESERFAGHGPAKRALKRAIVGRVMRACDGWMPMGELGIRYFERYGATRDRCFFSPNITDYARFSGVGREEAEGFCVRHGMDPARKRVLLCGRMVGIKRFDLVIDAFARFAPGHEEWDLLAVGDGPLSDELRARVPGELESRVHWIGSLPWEDVPAAFACAHTFVLSSDIEPWGIVLLEAMLAGNATIATRVTQAADEIIEDGVSGRLIEPGSVDAMHAALEDVCAPEHLERYRANARTAIREWIGERDPVIWIRKALDYYGVLRSDTTA